MSGKPFHPGAIILLFTTLALLACSSGETAPTSTLAPPPTLETSGGSITPFPPTPVPTGGISASVISSDLAVGPNRLIFFLLGSDSMPVTGGDVDVSIYYPSDTSGAELKDSAKAIFRPWPLGGLGVYTTQVDISQAGAWGIRVAIAAPDGSSRLAQGIFQVKEESSTPAIGSPAPPSKNKTSRDVGSLEELTTARPPDPDLYSMTISEALNADKPLVVVFATPAFCQTATCGPQVQVVEGVKDKYGDRASFIHVEVFDNPHEIQGDLSRARPVATVDEWGLPTEPWTFIVDRQGRIAAKFEAFTTAEEIEEGLQRVLQ